MGKRNQRVWCETTGWRIRWSKTYYKGDVLCSVREYSFIAEEDTDLVAVYVPIGSARLTLNGGPRFTINGVTKTTEVVNVYPLGSRITVHCLSEDFEYWKNSAGMIVSRDPNYTFTVTSNEVVAAVLNIVLDDQVTVLFESYYGQVLGRDQVVRGELIAEPGIPYRYGYTALGWDYNGDGSYDAEDTFANAVERGFDSDKRIAVVVPVYQVIDSHYTISVTNGSGSGEYVQNEVVIAVADAPEEGYKFSHWEDESGKVLSYKQTYRFYAAKDMTLKAIYVENEVNVEAKGVTEIVDTYIDAENGKLGFVSMSTVPEGCTIEVAGIIATNDEAVGTSGDGFDEESAKYVRGSAWSGTSYRFTWTKSNVAVGDTWYVRAYLVYTDPDENVITLYGDMVSLTMAE